MAPRKKLTAKEVLARRKEFARRRREKIKNDPVLAALEAEKERKKYEMKKAKKQVKLVKDMTPREHLAARRLWREKCKKHYAKRKAAAESERLLAANSPNSDAVEVVSPLVHSRRTAGSKKKKSQHTKSEKTTQQDALVGLPEDEPLMDLPSSSGSCVVIKQEKYGEGSQEPWTEAYLSESTLDDRCVEIPIKLEEDPLEAVDEVVPLDLEEDDLRYFKSLAPDLAALTPDLKEVFRIKVKNILAELTGRC